MTNQLISPQLTQISTSLVSTEGQLQAVPTQVQAGLQAVQLVLSNVSEDAAAIRSLAEQLRRQEPEL